MRSTLHYHLPALCLLFLTAAILYTHISPCRLSRERDLEGVTSPGSRRQISFDPWDKFSTILITIISNILFIVLWFPETFFYIKGNLQSLTFEEIKVFIGSVYLMVSAKGLIILLFTVGVKDTRISMLLRKRASDEAELLDMEDVQTSSVV